MLLQKGDGVVNMKILNINQIHELPIKNRQFNLLI